MKYILCLGLLGLLLWLPGINVIHHIDLPKLDPYRITSHMFVTTKYPFIHHQYDIRLENIIYGQSLFYNDIFTVLQQAHHNDVVVFHLAGYGGDGEVMEQLINNVHQSYAHVIMSVEGDVYSAHSYLAVSGNELKMSNYSFMHFHASTILNLNCKDESGVDRGVSNMEHCQTIKNAIMNQELKLIDSIPLLTPYEKVKILTGHDVIISSDDYHTRTGTE